MKVLAVEKSLALASRASDLLLEKSKKATSMLKIYSFPF
jgi:hypothetical protein